MPFEGGEPKTFAGIMAADKFGVEPGHFRVPTDVACDKRGRAYVADYMNDRVQIFNPDGKLLKVIAVNKPAQIRIHQRTQELWVFSYSEIGVSSDIMRAAKLEKLSIKPILMRFGSFDHPVKISEPDLPLGVFDSPRISGHKYPIALDSWVEPPTIWLVGGNAEWTPLDIWWNGWRDKGDDWSSGGIRILSEKNGRWAPSVISLRIH